MHERHKDIEQEHLVLLDLTSVDGSDADEEDCLADNRGDPEHAAKPNGQEAQHSECEVRNRHLCVRSVFFGTLPLFATPPPMEHVPREEEGF